MTDTRRAIMATPWAHINSERPWKLYDEWRNRSAKRGGVDHDRSDQFPDGGGADHERTENRASSGGWATWEFTGVLSERDVVRAVSE